MSETENDRLYLDRLSRDPYSITMRGDKRRARAQVLTAEVMRIVAPHICEHEDRDGHRRVYDQILRLFWNGGHEVLTDIDRANAGLPQRGIDGWTEPELQRYERYMRDALFAPTPMLVIDPSDQRITPAPSDKKPA